MRERVLLGWSGGKDSALALYELRQSGRFEVSALVTTVTAGYDRITMHGVRRVLLEKQAEAAGLPLEVVYLSQKSSTEEYEEGMAEVLLRYRQAGVGSVAFGDIYLREVRQYRERHLARVEMTGLFPLWGKETATLARSSIERRFRAVVTCVDTRALDRSFVGRIVDARFLETLPPGVDPCGENGEFHTFVFDAPVFQRAIPWQAGEVVLRDSFVFCDILPRIGAEPEDGGEPRLGGGGDVPL